jgi:hypothetical protein
VVVVVVVVVDFDGDGDVEVDATVDGQSIFVSIATTPSSSWPGASGRIGGVSDRAHGWSCFLGRQVRAE